MKDKFTNLANTGKQFTLYFVNGFQMRCTLLDFDDDILTVKDTRTGHQNLIFIHAVSTIDLG